MKRRQVKHKMQTNVVKHRKELRRKYITSDGMRKDKKTAEKMYGIKFRSSSKAYQFAWNRKLDMPF